MTRDDLIHATLKAALEVETTGYLWGQPSTFVPYLCDKVFGDGRALLALVPLNTRPCYYVIRIDSSWSIVDDKFHDLLEDGIYRAIEEQFGTVHDEDDETDEAAAWPAFDDGSGCSWDLMAWPSGTAVPP